MNAATLVSRSRLAHARVLARSFLEHHPGGHLHVLVFDGQPDDRGREPFELILPADLSLDRREFNRMAMIYSPLEFACALKPSVLAYLLDLGEDVAAYLDSDIEVFASLEEVVPLAREHGLVLTPHLTTPPQRTWPARLEQDVRLLGGGFNAGFIAIAGSNRRFLDWWTERLARDCLDAPQLGLFVDQRWLDFVPGYFPHHVLRDPGYNAAPWNLPTREVAHTDGGYLSNGVPLRFFHFGGFEPNAPWSISKWHRPVPHTRLSEHPALARLIREYAAKLYAEGFDEASRAAYGYAELPDGTPVTDRMRAYYRDALIAAERGGGLEPPNPFADGAEAFLAWLRQRSTSPPSAHTVPARLLAFHEQRQAVGLTAAVERAYCHWYAGRLFTAQGDIVELGCWVGALTAALAMGLRENPRPAARSRRLHAYDFFQWTYELDPRGTSASTSAEPAPLLRELFDRATSPWRDLIELHEGDLLELGWPGEEIEMLVVDAMKSWRLADGIPRRFFSHLIPGTSLVLHQDFSHHATYWIHLVMYRLREYFEPEHEIPETSSVIFRLTQEIPERLLDDQVSLETFSRPEVERAFDYSRSIVAPARRLNVSLAKIMALIDLGELADAERELEPLRRLRVGGYDERRFVEAALAERVAA